MIAHTKTSLKLSGGILSVRRPAKLHRLSPRFAPPTRPLRILSIDGGGIKGIVPATILVHLEEKLQALSGKPDARITDYFDWVAGSSTGGILACFYLLPDPINPTRAKLSAAEALELYLQQGRQAFQRTPLQQLRNKLGLATEKYSHRKLERQLKKTIGRDVTLQELIRPCLIPTFMQQEDKPVFFNSQTKETDRFGSLKAWQVAKATSSAPGFFRPTLLKGKNGNRVPVIDGSVWTTDPALCAYQAAKEKRGESGATSKREAPDNTILLSLGTGKMSRRYLIKELRKQKANGKLMLNKMLAKQSSSTQQQICKIFASQEPGGAYYRLDPQLTEATSAMDNVSCDNLRALHETGLQYIEQQRAQLEEIAQRLVDSERGY